MTKRFTQLKNAIIIFPGARVWYFRESSARRYNL